jgi:hypothetical protein
MIELVKLIALSLILTKDGIKLHHVFAEYKKEAREAKLTFRRILTHVLAMTLATAAPIFYAMEVPAHVEHLIS